MAYIDKNPAMVLNELASLNPQQRREVAAALRGGGRDFHRGARRPARRPHAAAAGPLPRPPTGLCRPRPVT